MSISQRHHCFCTLVSILIFGVSVANSLQLSSGLPGAVSASDCTPSLSESELNVTHLCRQCRRFRKLPDNYVPRILQEETCMPEQRSECLHGHGTCRQRYTLMTLLINNNTNGDADWLERQVHVPAGCECRVPLDSPLTQTTTTPNNSDQTTTTTTTECKQRQYADDTMDLCFSCGNDELLDIRYKPSRYRQNTCASGKMTCLGGIGECRPHYVNRHLLMRLEGSDKYVEEHVQIPVGCECWLPKPSEHFMKLALQRATLSTTTTTTTTTGATTGQ